MTEMNHKYDKGIWHNYNESTSPHVALNEIISQLLYLRQDFQKIHEERKEMHDEMMKMLSDIYFKE